MSLRLGAAPASLVTTFLRISPEAVFVASAGGVLTSTGGATCSLGTAAEPEPEPEPEPVGVATACEPVCDGCSFPERLHAQSPNDKNRIVVPLMFRPEDTAARAASPVARPRHACAKASRVRL